MTQGTHDTILKAVFDLKDQIGEIHADIIEVKTDGKNTLKQVEKANDRVTRIEQIELPAIHKELSRKTTYDDCKSHKINLIKDKESIQNEIKVVKERTNAVT